jgi:hypothetical protein
VWEQQQRGTAWEQRNIFSNLINKVANCLLKNIEETAGWRIKVFTGSQSDEFYFDQLITSFRLFAN